jgi:hypothetical protein
MASLALRNGVQATSHVYAAAIAGPALMYAGYKFPGSWQSRLFLVGSGALLVAAHYPFFVSMVNTKTNKNPTE